MSIKVTKYQFFEPVKVPAEEEFSGIRYLIPHSDPMEYKHPFDFIFDTPEQAEASLEDWDIPSEESDEWVLMKVTKEIVERK